MKIQRDENDMAQNPLYAPSPSQAADKKQQRHHARNSTQLPTGWDKHNNDQGRRYYSNKDTQAVQWTAPEGATGGSASETFTEGDVYNPMDWDKNQDEHGTWFYTNKETQESQWEAPAGVMGGSASETFTEVDVYNPMDKGKRHHARNSTQLPPDWDKHNDDQGRRYYSNKNTQAAQWTAPEGATGGSASVSVPAKKD